MTKRKRVKNNVGTALWNERIEPFVRHAIQNRGFQTRVAEVMTKEFKICVAAPQVQQWLAPDRAVRVEPKAGTAEYLLTACKRVRDGSAAS